MAVGLVIGTERECTHRPAGMRTHILVALGACSVMLTGHMISVQYAEFSPDPARLGAQVITGVGFLGAGTILREGIHVKGLTTAASLWTVACLGIAAGGGYYTVAIAGMVLTLLTLTAMEVLQRRLLRKPGILLICRLDVSPPASGLSTITRAAGRYGVDITDLLVTKTAPGTYRIAFRAGFKGFRTQKRRRRFLKMLLSDPTLKSLRTRHDDPSSRKIHKAR